MAELTMMIDGWEYVGLEEYLISLDGVLDVNIQNKEALEVYIKYNPNLITPKIIKMEILLFLDILNIPSIIAFDKHSNIETSEYKIMRDDICCEYCLKATIEDLLEIEGVEKAECNFFEYYSPNKDGDRGNIIININYNSNLINIEDMKQIELDLNI